MEQDSGKDSQEKTGLTRRTLSGTVWMMSGSMVLVVLRFITLMILARLLTPEDYGLVGAAMIVVNFAQLFSQLGLGPALIQRPSLEERHLRTAFTVFTITGILFGSVILASAPLIAGFFHKNDLIPILRVAGIAFPLQGLAATPTALLSRELKFRSLAKINVLTYFGGSGIVGIGMALLGFGAWALVGALLAQLLINVIVLLFVKPFPKAPMFDRLAFNELVHYGGGFTIGRILNYVASQGDNLVVGRWLGVEALGFYDRAYQMLVFPANLFGNIIDQVSFPSMAKVQNSPERLALAYRRGIALTALIYLPMSVAIVALAPELVRVILGPSWENSVIPFQILAAGMLFRASKINNAVANATGEVYKRAWRQGVYAVAIFTGAWVGHHWGLTGVAIGVFAALMLNFILMVHLSLTLTSLPWRRFLGTIAPSLLLAVITFVQVWLVAMVLRSLEASALVILIGSGVVAGLGLLLSAYLKPQVFLGKDGMWMLQAIMKYVGQKMKLPAGLRKAIEKWILAEQPFGH